MDRIHIKPTGLAEWAADMIMAPIMYLVSGTIREKPQRTHPWNVCRMPQVLIGQIDRNKTVSFRGIQTAVQPHIARLHLPILGGWRHYEVLEPTGKQDVWRIGWIAAEQIKVSKVPLRGPVRVLLGPSPVSFFGVGSDGSQIEIKRIGSGMIGRGGPYTKMQLL